MSTTDSIAPEIAAPRPRRKPLWRTLLKPLASLQLTVVLFSFAIALVFFGTLAQKTLGLWTVVDRYFWSWFVMVDGQPILEFGKIFLTVPPSAQAPSWFTFPLPAGKLLGGAMMINLLAAHILRFRLTWKRSGIFILHAGMMLMFVGEYITREYQVEQHMVIREGQSAVYASETRNFELAFINDADSSKDRVTVIPRSILQNASQRKERISHPDFPYDVEVIAYYPNSLVVPATHPRAPQVNIATAGEGKVLLAVNEPEVSGADTSQQGDLPSAYVALHKKDGGGSIGTYLVSLQLEELQRVESTPTLITLRHARHYKPFQLELIKFSFDRYIGTDTPKNYSSQVRLIDPEKGQNREYLIRMNEPMYYRGETFYQAGFTPDEKGTILQVVQNPGAFLPYISCGMVTAGLLIHFMIMLVAYLMRVMSGKLNRQPVAASAAQPLNLTPGKGSLLHRLLPAALAIALAGLTLFPAFMSKHPKKDDLDLQQIALLPVVDGGRVKPLDTVARVNMRLISHKEQYVDNAGMKQDAIRWYMDCATSNMKDDEGPAKLEIFRIENDQVRQLLKLNRREGLRYSLKELRPQSEAFEKELKKVREIPDNSRDPYQQKLHELGRHVEIFLGICVGEGAMILPADGDLPWRKFSTAQKTYSDRLRKRLQQRLKEEGIVKPPEQMNQEEQLYVVGIIQEYQQEELKNDRLFGAWIKVLSAYKENDVEKYNKAISDYQSLTEQLVPKEELKRVRFEMFMNQSGLYFWCSIMYILASGMALAGLAALLFSPSAGNFLRRWTFWLLVFTFLLNTFTLVGRMYLSDRWGVFVTNLYSSAVFIGWAITATCLIVEIIYPLGIGNLIAAVLGAIMASIAHNLALNSGDTLEVMRAVLDDNGWLASHVTTVTFGYAATYIAGLIALIYTIFSVFPEKWILRKQVTIGSDVHAITTDIGKILGQLLYAIICFATLLSFVGTVLGGIWADYSWGRFWGWDPKENGAVLIVIWNVLILHARWCGLVKERGMMALALVGNIITTWSWFGTNQLGVGLHAYGFNNQLVLLCDVVWAASILAIIACVLPWQWVWKANSTPPQTQVPPLPVGRRVKR